MRRSKETSLKDAFSPCAQTNLKLFFQFLCYSSKSDELNEAVTVYDAALHHSLWFKRIFSPIFSFLYLNCIFNLFVKLFVLLHIIFMTQWNESYKSSLLLAESVASVSLEFFNLLLSSYLNDDVQNEV